MNDVTEIAGLRDYPLARRGMMMTGLISGFTLATQRVEAQAIHTDDDRPRGRRDGDPDHGRQPAGLLCQPGRARAVPDHPGERRDLRRPRIHQGRLPAAAPRSAIWRWRPSITPASAISRR